MIVKALRGTRDLLPPETVLWQRVEEIGRRWFGRFGYEEVRPPLLEEAKLFQLSVGEHSDIVEKQMYTFTDRGERVVCLRPEATASVARAYLEAGVDRQGGVAKWYYIGPMFRSERPQAGRQRQFHQMGVESFGSTSPFTDAEVLLLLMRLLEAAGASGSHLRLNSIGCANDRPAVSQRLREGLESQASALCEDCQRRLTRNVFRILDCKEPGCQRISRQTGGVVEWVCQECTDHLSVVQQALERSGVTYELDPYLVRGLDYYTRTTFEVQHPALGAQDAVAAGGRYDGLIQELGGPPTGAVGFAIGVERLLMVLGAQPAAAPGRVSSVFVACVSESARWTVFELGDRLRRAGVTALVDCDGRSLKAQLRRADRLGCRYTALVGDEELSSQSVTLRDMETGEQRAISMPRVSEELAALLTTHVETNTHLR